MNQADQNSPCPQSPVQRYYRLHSHIYDATRWSFLFGRGRLMRRIATDCPAGRILEVSCGTGGNLLDLSGAFPDAEIVGLDVSQDMLRIAGRKLTARGCRAELLHRAYDHPLRPERPFDLVVFSYCLSMINPGWDRAIQCAGRDLAPGGWIGVVDFHDSPCPLLKRWMALHHVRMEGHLLPRLGEQFVRRNAEVRRAYLGLWSYFTFLGRR